MPKRAPPPQLRPQNNCSACKATKHQFWRTGPAGRKTLCGACYDKYKRGRLILFKTDEDGRIGEAIYPEQLVRRKPGRPPKNPNKKKQVQKEESAGKDQKKKKKKKQKDSDAAAASSASKKTKSSSDGSGSSKSKKQSSASSASASSNDNNIPTALIPNTNKRHAVTSDGNFICGFKKPDGSVCHRRTTDKFEYLCFHHFIAIHGKKKYLEIQGMPVTGATEGEEEKKKRCERCGSTAAGGDTAQWHTGSTSDAVLCDTCFKKKGNATSTTPSSSRKRKKRKAALPSDAELVPLVKRRRKTTLDEDATSRIAPAVPVGSSGTAVDHGDAAANSLAPRISSDEENHPIGLARDVFSPTTHVTKPLKVNLLPEPARLSETVFSRDNLLKHAAAVQSNPWIEFQLKQCGKQKKTRGSKSSSHQKKPHLKLDTLIYMLTFCQEDTLLETQLVSTTWNIASNDRVIWKYQYHSRWPVAQQHLSTYVNIPQRQQWFLSLPSHLSPLDDGLDWKHLYYVRGNMSRLSLNPIQLAEYMCKFYSIEANPQILDSIIDKVSMHRNYHEHVLSIHEKKQKLSERDHVLDAIRSVAENPEKILAELGEIIGLQAAGGE